MLDFLLGLVIGRSNPNQCFTDKKYNKYLENQRRIKEEAFRQREEKERKEREEALKRTCKVPSFYRDENIYTIIDSLAFNPNLVYTLKNSIKKGYGYMFFIEVGESDESGRYLRNEKRVFESRSLDKTVEKFTELCNSNEHYFKVKISFELEYKGIKTSTWVIVWNEKDRKIVLNYTPTLLYALNTDE